MPCTLCRFAHEICRNAGKLVPLQTGSFASTLFFSTHGRGKRGKDGLGIYRDPMLKLRDPAETNYYNEHITKLRQIPERNIIKSIIEQRRKGVQSADDSNLYDIGNEFLEVEFASRHMAQEPSNIIDEKINELVNKRFNFNAVAACSAAIPQETLDPGGVDNRLNTQGSDANASHTYGEKQSLCLFNRLGKVYDNKHVLEALAEYYDFDTIEYNNCLVPSNYKTIDALSQYRSVHLHAAFLTKGYSLCAEFSGEHASNVLDQLITFSVNNMQLFDVQYGCLIDSKANILDTCYVCKVHDSFVLVTNGLNKKGVYDYISAYVLRCRQNNLQVTVRPLNCDVIALYGPKSMQVLDDIASGLITINKFGTMEIDKMADFMKCCNVTIQEEPKKETRFYAARFSDIGEDGFDFIVPRAIVHAVARMLLSHELVQPCGFTVYDVARLEAGMLRSDVDLPPETSPQQASVLWSLDVRKLKSGVVFGSTYITSALQRGVAKVRVGLLTNVPLDPECKILSEATRKPIGFVTSYVHSPVLKMYVAHAYVSSIHAKHNVPVIISIAAKPKEDLSKRDYKLHYRTGVYRTFARGTIVHLPFILHNYPIVESEKAFVGGKQVPFATCKSQDATKEVRQSNRVGSKKELWKQRVAEYRKKANGTVEMALSKLREMNETNDFTHVYQGTTQGWPSLHLIPLQRINLGDSKVPRESIIAHYNEIHSKDILPRHGRFRPSF